MKTRYRLIRRGNRSGAFYCVDTVTGKRTSLGTANEDEARQIVEAKNQAQRQPVLNLHIAKAYLAGTDNGITTRTWQNAIEALINTKRDANRTRWHRVLNDSALAPLWTRVIIETPGELLLKILQVGTVSTNVFLRRLHNFCVDMNWLPWPLIPKRQWPAVRFKEKRAITWEEHCRIIAREKNPEWRAFYELAWHLGASQSDLAEIDAEDIDWENRVISFDRMKTRWRGQQPPQVCIGNGLEILLSSLPNSGPLFPYLRTIRACDRATAFKKRCRGLGIVGLTLHSYRYAWAERAKVCGYPERFAQQALGHNSKAVHRAYAKKAQVRVPALEEYEKAYSDGKIIPMRMQKADAVETLQTNR
ncbi:MAG TPA: tyrosine-type recombinase/integrase [Verrucomicrobiae bacterium]|nr:tyrosine-type recombinase/integrase [Verrucomicrobiae bacterium]